MRVLNQNERDLVWRIQQKLRNNCFEPAPIQFTKEEVWYLATTMSVIGVAGASPFDKPSDGSWVA